MGRKGTSKRKPKKIKPTSTTSNANISGNSPVQALVGEKGAPKQNDNAKSSGGWNKKNKKQ